MSIPGYPNYKPDSINTELFELLKDKLGLSAHCRSFTLQCTPGEFPKVRQTYYVQDEKANRANEIAAENHRVTSLSKLNKKYLTDMKHKIRPEKWDDWVETFNFWHESYIDEDGSVDYDKVEEDINGFSFAYLKEEFMSDKQKLQLKTHEEIREILEEVFNGN